MFFEFDSFKTKPKMIPSGKLQDKRFGTIFKENKTIEADTIFKENLLRDTVVFEKNLRYYSSIEKNVYGADSVITHIFLLATHTLFQFMTFPIA
jgi:hypothetical protein